MAIIVEGAISVKAVLASKYRKVNRIYLQSDKSGKDISFICTLANKAKIKVEKCSKEKIESLAVGKTHGGILAEVSQRKLQSWTSLMHNDKPFIALIEGVEDNYNFGYMLRTLYAFGCDGVIVNGHNYNFEDPTIIKSSAGASELMPIVNSDDLTTLLEILKSNGVKIVSAYRGSNPIDMYDYDFASNGILVCVGGPLRGLSRVVLDNSDNFIFIPYANDFKNALNGASAISVISSEVYRQRRSK